MEESWQAGVSSYFTWGLKGNLHGTGRLQDSATYIPEGKTLTYGRPAVT